MHEAQWVKSLRTLERHDRFHHQYVTGDIDVFSGPLLSTARNDAVEHFLDTEHDWLWCHDDDMVFHPDTLDRMMDLADVDERPIIGSVYYGGGIGVVVRPHVFLVFTDEDGHPYTEIRDEFPRDKPFEVDACGAGGLLVHRRVLEAVGEKWSPYTAYPWFAETEAHKRKFGEDVSFCIRARGCGFPIWMDPTIWWGHVKRVIIDAASYDAQQALVKEISVVYSP